MQVYRADFNEFTDYDHLIVRGPTVNDRVALIDDDGNYCVGTIVAMRPTGIMDVDPDWSTWVPGQDIANAKPHVDTL